MEESVEADRSVRRASGEDEEAQGSRGVYSVSGGLVHVWGCGRGEGEVGVRPGLQTGVAWCKVTRRGCGGEEM